MLQRRPVALGLFAAWTLLVWVGRVRNILDDPALDGDRVGALIPVTAFIVAGLAVGWVALGRAEEITARRVMTSAAVFTVGYWAVRMAVIVVRDHPAGFVVVHAVLALVSAGTALWAWRVVARPVDGPRPDGAPGDGGGRTDTVSTGSDPGGV